jgi:hypothetical protein
LLPLKSFTSKKPIEYRNSFVSQFIICQERGLSVSAEMTAATAVAATAVTAAVAATAMTAAAETAATTVAATEATAASR